MDGQCALKMDSRLSMIRLRCFTCSCEKARCFGAMRGQLIWNRSCLYAVLTRSLRGPYAKKTLHCQCSGGGVNLKVLTTNLLQNIPVVVKWSLTRHGFGKKRQQVQGTSKNNKEQQCVCSLWMQNLLAAPKKAQTIYKQVDTLVLLAISYHEVNTTNEIVFMYNACKYM